MAWEVHCAGSFGSAAVSMGSFASSSHANDSCGRGKQLHTAAASAGAGHAVGLDHQVPRFAGHAVVAMPDAVVEDDAVADPGAKGEHAEGMNAGCAGRAELEFGQRRGIGVAVEEDGLADGLLDGGAKLEAVPAGKIRRVADDARGQFQRAGAADADPQQTRHDRLNRERSAITASFRSRMTRSRPCVRRVGSEISSAT